MSRPINRGVAAGCSRRPCQHEAIADDPEAEDPAEQSAELEPQDDDAHTPSAFDRWRRQSALGEVGTGIAKGLRNIFAPTQDQPAIVASVPGDPPDADQRMRVILDPDDPTKSIVIFPETGAHQVLDLSDDESPPQPPDEQKGPITPADQD